MKTKLLTISTENGTDALAEAAQEIDAAFIRRTFAARYGKGWQSKLARKFGLADSTISGWLKHDSVPQWAKISLAALLHHEQAPATRAWHVVERDGSFEIWSLDCVPARVVARGIERIEDANLLAAAPLLYDACANMQPVFRDYVRNQSDDHFDEWAKSWSEYHAEAQIALNAAKPPGDVSDKQMAKQEDKK